MALQGKNGNIAKSKLWSLRFLLLVVSLLLTLCLLEVALRSLYPKYQYAADSDYQKSETRIWSRNSNSHYQRLHPDTQAIHWVCHNNLGLRQHRNFSEQQLEASTTLAFFGDSFTENLRIPTAYSFTEPFDYLLNFDSEHPYTTLNFGIDGYGTDQSYLYYREAAAKTRLDHVFYIFTANDLRNIFENKLFILENENELKQNPPQKTPWAIRFISKFHLTYFIIENIDRLFYKSTDLNKRIHLQSFIDHTKNYHSEEADAIEEALRSNPESAQLQENITLFNRILKRWKSDVEKAGGQFHLIILPRAFEDNASALTDLTNTNVVNLYKRFSAKMADDNYARFIFKNDPHWNETGNAWAARELYEYFQEFTNQSPMDNAHGEQGLHNYYSAIGWPETSAEWRSTDFKQNAEPESIVQKYTSIEIAFEQ